MPNIKILILEVMEVNELTVLRFSSVSRSDLNDLGRGFTTTNSDSYLAMTSAFTRSLCSKLHVDPSVMDFELENLVA